MKHFPITYLGLPLSVHNTPTSALLPLLDKLSEKLATWKASLLSCVERLALMRHVLSVMPVHILLAMAINPAILKKIIHIIRISYGMDKKTPKSAPAWSPGLVFASPRS